MAQTKIKLKRTVLKKGERFWEFCRNFFIWLLGIVFTAVPVFLKHLKIYSNNNSTGNYNFFTAILSDFEFSFISVSVLFMLCLENMFLRDKVPAWHKPFRICIFLCLLITGSAYCVAFFIRDQLLPNLPVTQFEYNMVTFCLAVVFGVECHISIVSRKGGAAC